MMSPSGKTFNQENSKIDNNDNNNNVPMGFGSPNAQA